MLYSYNLAIWELKKKIKLKLKKKQKLAANLFHHVQH